MTQEQKDGLLAEAIGMLMKVYAMHTADKKLTERDLEYMEGIIETFFDEVRKENE